MSDKIKVLVVAQTPPPFHGQAVMTQYFLEGKYQNIGLLPIRMAFSGDIKSVGQPCLGKVFHLFSLIAQIAWLRVQGGVRILYYPPASPNMVPFLRDCVLLIATRWMFSRTVFHFHATGISSIYESLPAFLKPLYRLAYSRPDLSICLSSLLCEDAKNFDSHRVTVVPNGIPDQQKEDRLEKTLKTDAASPLVLYLGTVSEEKGVGILLTALAALAGKGIDFRCVIAGPFVSQDDESHLRRLCFSLGLDGSVDWRGPVSGEAKWSCYRSADVFCFPTFYPTEGFPVVLLEAMMFSLPVVASAWRAIPEIVREGNTGFLVPPRDASATARQLEILLLNSALRKSFGREARQRYLEHYTVEAFRSQMEAALASVK